MDPRRRGLLAGAVGGWQLGGAPARAGGPTAIDEARASLRRLLGPLADTLALAIRPAAQPFWRFDARGDAPRFEASSPVALVRGVVSVLSDQGLAHVAWDGRRSAGPEALQALQALQGHHEQARSPFRHRAYLNPCTYGYTTPFWDFARWEQEIDWMAAHGIDLPLAMEGQEFVWRALWRAEGLADEELAAYFSGPAFMPWQRMGNIEGYRGPVPEAFFTKKRDLQRQILQRLRALGMTPVLPGFAGYVPKALARRHPQARIYRMVPWGGFHETCWLDPTDPLFARLQRRYLDLYEQTYGRGSHWLVDAFNEMLPPLPSATPARDAEGFLKAEPPSEHLDPALRDRALARHGQALHRGLSQARPGAVFVMQGWMFGFQQKFWTPEAIAAFLSRMPPQRTLVLDLANDTYPGGWARARAFSGRPWIFGYVLNFGGNTALSGDLALVQRDLAGLLARRDTGRLAGIGLFPEGLHTNPLVYAWLLDQAWAPSDAPLATWLQRHARSRYASAEPALAAALQGVAEAFYRTRNWDFGWQGGFGTYLLCKRPHADLARLRHAEDLPAARRAVAAFVALWPRFGQQPAFRHDAVAFLVHLASLALDHQLADAITAFQAGRTAEGDALWSAVREQLADLDLLLGEMPDSLHAWLAAARDYGSTAAESAAYVDNALAQVTVWGGDNVLNDYASKAWQGLYEDFYRARWALFFEALRRDGERLDGDAMKQALAAFDAGFVAARRIPPLRRADDAAALALRILARVSA